MRVCSNAVLDSIGRPAAGIMDVTMSDFGDYDQCLAIKSMEPGGIVDFRGQHCNIAVRPPALPPLNRHSIHKLQELFNATSVSKKEHTHTFTHSLTHSHIHSQERIHAHTHRHLSVSHMMMTMPIYVIESSCSNGAFALLWERKALCTKSETFQGRSGVLFGTVESLPFSSSCP